MRIISVVRFAFFIMTMVAFFFAYSDFVFADVVSPFQGSANPETKMNGVFKGIIDFVLYIAMGFGGIGMAWGLAELNGFIGDKKNGTDKLKTGAIVLATAGIATAVISKLAGLSV